MNDLSGAGALKGAASPFFKYLSPVPVLLYAGLIFYLSSRPIPNPLHPFPHFDKVLHFLEFFLMGLLISLTFRIWKGGKGWGNPIGDGPSRERLFRKGVKREFFMPFVISFFYAGTDELHQAFVPTRTASLLDLFIDGAGALAGAVAFCIYFGKRRGND